MRIWNSQISATVSALHLTVILFGLPSAEVHAVHGLSRQGNPTSTHVASVSVATKVRQLQYGHSPQLPLDVLRISQSIMQTWRKGAFWQYVTEFRLIGMMDMPKLLKSIDKHPETFPLYRLLTQKERNTSARGRPVLPWSIKQHRALNESLNISFAVQAYPVYESRKLARRLNNHDNNNLSTHYSNRLQFFAT